MASSSYRIAMRMLSVGGAPSRGRFCTKSRIHCACDQASSSSFPSTVMPAPPDRRIARTCFGGGVSLACAAAALAILFVAEMPLLLEDPQQRADRGVARRVGELIEHLGGGRATPAVDHLHDLAFPTAELRARFFGHGHAPDGWMLKK